MLKEAVALRHNRLYGRESCRLGRGGKKKLWQEIASHVNNVAEHRRKPDDVRRRFEFIRNKLRSRAGRLATGGVSRGSAVPNGRRSPDTTSDELTPLEEELMMGVSNAVDILTEWGGEKQLSQKSFKCKHYYSRLQFYCFALSETFDGQLYFVEACVCVL